MFKILTLLAGVLIAPAALAQANWRDIPCSQSRLELPGLSHCATAGPMRTEGSSWGVAVTLYGTEGSSAGVYTNLLLYWPPAGVVMDQYNNARAIEAIKEFNSVTLEKATDWGDLRSIGNTSYMQFKIGGQGCIGFDHPGPLQGVGYAWHLSGYRCGDRGKPEDIAKALVASIRVGK